MTQPSRTRRILKGLILAVAVVLAVVVIVYFIFDEPVPKGEPGLAAEQMAQRMMVAVDHNAWLWTGAVTWNFDGRQEHLWDRKRNFARVRWDDVEVYIALGQKVGFVFRDGERLPPDQSGAYLDQAWAHWANDSFWLNPVSKIMDYGVQRSLVDLKNGEKGLLVTYTQGGVTPGDSYLWVIGDDGLPIYWKMWVSILPIGGLKVTWEDWVTLGTGVKVATKHQTPIGDLTLTDVQAAKTVQALLGEDPFAGLEAMVKPGGVKAPPAPRQDQASEGDQP